MINERQARKFCKEDLSKIENYDKAIADTTQTWHCHHRTEIWWNCSKQDLIDNECYYNRKACELIFLTSKEHNRLHKIGKKLSEDTRRKMSEAKKNISDETRRKLSEALKGENNPNFGKHNHHSEETRRKISESLKGKPAQNKGKTTSIFGEAYKEHYGITRCDNVKLYNKEYLYYNHHGHFSWEN